MEEKNDTVEAQGAKELTEAELDKTYGGADAKTAASWATKKCPVCGKRGFRITNDGIPQCKNSSCGYEWKA